MKKLLSLLLTFLLLVCLTTFVGCEGNGEKITIVVPDGAPVVTVYNLLREQKQVGGYDVDVKIVSGTTQIESAIRNGVADVAVAPTNISAKLYNEGLDIKIASVNIFGVLYMIGSQPISSLNDLIGKVIVYTGAGGTPELTLKLILDENNIPYEDSQKAVDGKVAITAVSQGSDAIAMVNSNKADYAVLGEPVVTQANSKFGMEVVLDLTKEWNKIVGENSYMQAGVVLSNSVYNKGVFVRGLMEALSQNGEVLKSDYENVAGVLENAGSSLRVAFTLDTVTRLNIGHKTAVESKESLGKYFNAIMDYKPALIGGKLPDENFYLGYEK